MNAEQLVINHMDLAVAASNKFSASYLSQQDREDMYGEACIALVKASQHYGDRPRTKDFAHYALSCMYNEMIVCYRKNKKAYRQIHESDPSERIEEEEPSYWMEEDVVRYANMKDALNTLTEKELFVVQCRLFKGMTQKQCAQAMKVKFGMPSCSQPYIVEILNHVRAKFTEFEL